MSFLDRLMQGFAPSQEYRDYATRALNEAYPICVEARQTCERNLQGVELFVGLTVLQLPLLMKKLPSQVTTRAKFSVPITVAYAGFVMTAFADSTLNFYSESKRYCENSEEENALALSRMPYIDND